MADPTGCWGLASEGVVMVEAIGLGVGLGLLALGSLGDSTEEKPPSCVEASFL